MNIEALNSQIDQFFDSITPNEVVALFEEIGYEFERKDAYEKFSTQEQNQATKKLDFGQHFFTSAESNKIKDDNNCNFKTSSKLHDYIMAA